MFDVKRKYNVSGFVKRLKSYRDGCVGSQGTYMNDKRNMFHDNNPTMFVKLRSAAKKFILSKE